MAVLGIDGNRGTNGLFTGVLYYMISAVDGKQTIEIAFKDKDNVLRFPLDKEECIKVYEK